MPNALVPAPPEPREVLVLGAGFSRNISKQFPITDELGRQAARHAGIRKALIPAEGFRDGNFETWLSQLAEDQPYLTEAENFANRARFMDAASAIVETLRAREFAAFRRHAPSWLYELLAIVHYRQALIVTLNYDTVLEVALATIDLPRIDESAGPSSAPLSGEQLPIGADDVLANFPPRIRGSLPARGIAFNGEAVRLAKSFRLLKLHGSLDWHWASGDPTGETLRRMTTTSRFGEPRDDPELHRQEVEGLQPFIVPPTATKSPYYSNLRTRWLWQQASDVLNSASRISLLGYSLPPADLVMSGMLERAVRRPDVDVDVIDLNPDHPQDRLKRLGAKRIATVGGPQCIRDFVTSYRLRASAGLVGVLRDDKPRAEHLLVQLSRTNVRAVERVRRTGSVLRLDLRSDAVPSLGVSSPRLLARLGGADRLVARTVDGRSFDLVACLHRPDDEGPQGQRGFLVLLAAGQTT